MVDPELVAILCCPETHQPVQLAPAGVLARVWAERLPDRQGRPPDAPLEGGLVRADGALLFPVRADIPIMLMDEAIPLPPPVSAGA